MLIIFSLILSNIAFAQSYDSSGPGPSYYEGRPIDPAGEGRDYYREGDMIVYPAQISSEEKRMMERFARSDMSEDEMRKIAKSKFGESFDDMQFQKGMMEFKDRMSRKDAFSYENEGYGQRYYVGPSYEGYSKEHMVFGMIFQYIGDEIDPREIKQYCNEPEKIAEMVISKFKEKVGDLQKVCSQAEEQETNCQEISKKACSQIGTPHVREDSTELEKIQSIAYSCPPNKDAIIKSCILRIKNSIEQNSRHARESCMKRFEFEGERLLKECERFKEHQICEKEKFIERCMGGIKKEDFSRECSREECEPSPGMPSWLCPDGKTRAGPGKCKRGDDGRCGWEIVRCPEKTSCPKPACENAENTEKIDETGCAIYACPAQTKCPVVEMPVCASDTPIHKKIDEKGCPTYFCERKQCPEVPRPTCNDGERIQAYYDNAGCTTSYQCIRYENTCPEVQRPSCAEGQSMTLRHDDRGCIVGYECVSITSTSSITGNVVLDAYEDILKKCENSWHSQEKACAAMKESCDKDSMVERCVEQSRKNFEEHYSRIERDCVIHTESEIKAADDRCSRMDKERQRCMEESSRRCEHMKGVAEKCKETLTEENLRKFIADETKKRCKFTDIVADEDDIKNSDKAEIVLAVLNTATEADMEKLELFVDDLKEDLKLQDTTVYKGMIEPNNFGDVKLLPFVVNAKISAVASSERAKEVKAKIVSRQRAEEAAGKLASLRDSDVPDEYLYIIEDKASEVLDVSDQLEEIEKKQEQKGVGYKIRLFLGLAKAAEQEEIRQLEESKSKLVNSIGALAKLIDEVPGDVAKAILKEQVESLKKQQEDIEILIETKAKKSKGLLGLFG
ncbi:hypothetical protein HYY71_04560 [Candidatus Woesearchaeota archaeon]|nr:hypothetical protein [Candidatus Woesearchaeota archaeon]